MHTEPQMVVENPSTQDLFIPGPLLLLGAPGVGKGTQAQVLMSDFGIPQISTGEILRQNITLGTELGKRARVLMDQGLFVDDETVNGMVADRLHHKDVTNGYILDGYPRTLAQAEWLDAYLAGDARAATGARPGDADFAATLPLAAISIRVDENELLRRITGRRICPACKCSYNIYSQPPVVAGICDNDGTPLIQRPDDAEDAFAQRMVEYAAKTVQVIDHYRTQGQFEEVDGSQSVEAVTADIVAALRRLRARPAASPAQECR
jgi:adenylate kinase